MLANRVTLVAVVIFSLAVQAASAEQTLNFWVIHQKVDDVQTDTYDENSSELDMKWRIEAEDDSPGGIQLRRCKTISYRILFGRIS